MFPRARVARFLTDFDSSVNGVRAVGSFLKGKDHAGMSIGPSSRAAARLMTAPPDQARAMIFRGMGLGQGVPLHKAREIDVDELDQWVVRQYGRGPFPAVVIGSTSGGAVHLAAALGAPFLPQTTLVVLRDLATHPDDAVGAMETLAPTSRMLAERNPRVSVYHMHDPAQDRPMLEAMAYMRLKRLALGPVYEDFLTERLAPGGSIVQVECTRDWRTRAVGERAYFQFGCLGGVPEEEYHHSGERIARYLAQEGSPVRRWDPPYANVRRPEAEWGWDPALGEDIGRLTDSRGFRLRRLRSAEPQEHSPLVAELHRWWYRRRGLPDSRLLVESYAQWDPWWTLRTGSVPLWSRFNMEPAYGELEHYLAGAVPYDHIHLNLFSQGIESPGVVPVERWEDLVQRHARRRAEIIGVDEEAYPLDAGSTARYQTAFADIPTRVPFPAPLSITDIDRFAAEVPLHDDRTRWI